MIPDDLKKAALSIGARPVTVSSENSRAFMLWFAILIGVGTLFNAAFVWLVSIFLPVLALPLMMGPSAWMMWWVITQRSKGHLKLEDKEGDF